MQEKKRKGKNNLKQFKTAFNIYLLRDK